MNSQNRKKRSLLINPKFQWTLIGYAALVSVLILISIYALFSFGFHQFNQFGSQAGLAPDNIYFQFIEMQQSTFTRVIVAIAIVVTAILLIGGLYISHRIAGPIYRMQKELQDMSEEKPVDLRAIQFRKKDYFPELAETFNHLVEVWKKRQ